MRKTATLLVALFLSGTLLANPARTSGTTDKKELAKTDPKSVSALKKREKES